MLNKECYYLMNSNLQKKYGVSGWYPTLADYTFPTTFVKLKDSDMNLLAEKVTKGDDVKSLVKRIERAQYAFSGGTFVFADTLSPNDTSRFKTKKGAVHSAQSAWNNLTLSKKVVSAAVNREFDCICVRPYRNITYAREFRLFIYNGSLKLMSQRWLKRHYGRLEGRTKNYWKKAKSFVDSISWLLPDQTIVMDVYITSSEKILIIDFNTWGNPTDVLLGSSWDIDWNVELGIKVL